MKKNNYFAAMTVMLALSLGGCTAGEETVEKVSSEQGTTAESESTQDMQALYSTESDKKEYGEATIEGYIYIDGAPSKVSVTLSVAQVQKGEEAFRILQSENAEIPQPKEGEEYIIVTFDVTYNGGEAEILSMGENRASEKSYRLYFTLTNLTSNAQDMTVYLSNCIYNILLSEGESAQGAVAFLQEKENTQPMHFVGFGENVEFNVNEN